MVTIPSEHEPRLRELVRLFLERNAEINLSAFRTEETCWIGNVLDSLAMLQIADSLGGSRVLDVGTGGGFPLLPLAICRPDWSFVGLDSTRKKIAVVGELIEQLRLPNVGLHVARAEEAGHEPEHRGRYDIILARAIAPLPTLLEYCSPLAKPGGSLVLWKSLDIAAELTAGERAAMVLNCRFEHSHEYDLGGDWGHRQLLIYRQNHPTSSQYPRGSGLPKKRPLGE